jgi:hypothetical protein
MHKKYAGPYSLLEAGISLHLYMNSDLCSSPEDVNNGVMDNWMKLVKMKQLQRHDNESCTVFYYFSELRISHCIKNLFNDVCISTLIDAGQKGVLA